MRMCVCHAMRMAIVDRGQVKRTHHIHIYTYTHMYICVYVYPTILEVKHLSKEIPRVGLACYLSSRVAPVAGVL